MFYERIERDIDKKPKRSKKEIFKNKENWLVNRFRNVLSRRRNNIFIYSGVFAYAL